jgi:hypothetical protein
MNSIDLDEFLASLDANPEVQDVVNKYPQLSLTARDILNYTKTIGLVFWLENNRSLSRTIFLRINYIINCFRLFIRHDLARTSFKYNAESVFKKLGIYDCEDDFNKAVSVFKKYGVMEYDLIKAICFDEIQLNRTQTEEALDFLKHVLVLYKTTPLFLDERCPFFQVVIPVMCASSYEAEGRERQLAATWDVKLYTDEYELFFVRLDQLRKHKEEVKMKNAVKKQRALWSNSDGTMDSEMFFNVYELSEQAHEAEPDAPLMTDEELVANADRRVSSATSFFEARISPLKTVNLDSLDDFEFKDEEEFVLKYKQRCFLELDTPFAFDFYFFNKLAALMQHFVLERFDWRDVIVARDEDENFVKVRFEEVGKKCSRIQVEIKYADPTSMLELKSMLAQAVENLFEFYPGLYYTLSYRSE